LNLKDYMIPRASGPKATKKDMSSIESRLKTIRKEIDELWDKEDEASVLRLSNLEEEYDRLRTEQLAGEVYDIDF